MIEIFMGNSVVLFFFFLKDQLSPLNTLAILYL